MVALSPCEPLFGADLHPEQPRTPEESAAISYERYELLLDMDEEQRRVYLFVQDGHVDRGLITGERSGRFYALNNRWGDDFRQLKLADGRIAGTIRRVRGVTESFDISAVVDKGKISGTFTGVALVGGKLQESIAGKVTGEFLNEQQLKQRFSIASGHDWPAWSGPGLNFHASPGENQLVSHLDEARLIWRSEPTPPARSQDARYGFTDLRKPTGGTASPIVADGIVFMTWFVPSGEVADQWTLESIRNNAAARIKKEGREPTAEELTKAVQSVRHHWRITADDVVLAIDAATGKTLWKRVFEDAGINWPMTKTRSWNRTPCAANGMVFVQGSLPRIYALDAKTGRNVWNAELPAYATMKAAKEASLKSGNRNGKELRGSAVAGLVVVGKTLVCPDWRSGLVGLSLADGRQLWHLSGYTIGSNATPSRWTHRGKQYVDRGGAELPDTPCA